MNGQSAPHTPYTPPPRSGGFFASVRQLGIWRTQDRWAGGVAAGIAHRFGVDPLLIRGLFVVVTLFGGLGLVVYGLAWALLPEASDGRIHLEQAVRGHVDVALAGAAVTLIVGLSRPVFWWTSSWWAVPWVVVIGAVVAIVLLSRDRTPGPYPGQPGAAPTPPGPTYGAAAPGAPVHPAAAPSYAQPGPAYAHPATAPATQPDATGPTPPPRPAYDVPEENVPPTTHTGQTPATGPDPADTTTELPQDATDATAELVPDAPRDDAPAGATTAVLGAQVPEATVIERVAPDTATEEQPTEPLATDQPTTEHAGASGGYAYQGWDQGSGQSWDHGSGWTGGSGWDGPGDGGPGSVPTPQPPVPPKPPVPGPGSRMTSLVLAVALFAAAAVALAHYSGTLDGNPWLVGGGTVLAVTGLGVLVSGLRGRTQGGLGATALVLAILLVPTAAAAAALPGFARIGASSTTWAGDPTWVPATSGAAEQGHSLFAGDLVVDLTELDADEDLTVPAHVTFGNLTLIVPDDGAVTIDSAVGVGGIEARVDDDWDGPNLTRNTSNNTVATNGVGLAATLERAGSAPHITIDAEVSVGMIYIEEAS